jgi:hypothetical protein
MNTVAQAINPITAAIIRFTGFPFLMRRLAGAVMR